MHQSEYESRKRTLDDQLAAGIDLLRAGHRVQLRALELVWMSSPENSAPVRALAPEAPAPPPAPPPPPPPPLPPTQTPRRAERRWGIGELEDAVIEALDRLPEVFDRGDVIAALGERPERSSLYRVLEELRDGGTLEIVRAGNGRVPSRYRRRATRPEN
jgi:hypothetical protein